MTLADIKNDVRGLLQDDQFDEDLITQGANWYQNWLFARYRLRMAESDDTMTALAGATSVDFPSDMLTRIAIWCTSPNTFNMRSGFQEYETFMQNNAGFATASPAQARSWTEFGRAMRLSAPLSANHTFQIDYLRTPVDMENDGDDCELPDIYREMMARGTLVGMMTINEDYEEADQQRTDFLSPLETVFVRNEGRGGGKTGPAAVVRTNRGRSSWRADRDM